MNCTVILSTGKQCGYKPPKGKDICYRHDPERREHALDASRRGGENRSAKAIKYGQAPVLDTPNDIKLFLGQVIVSVWTGKVPPATAGSLGFLARCWLDAFDKSDLEKRIDEIERKLD